MKPTKACESQGARKVYLDNEKEEYPKQKILKRPTVCINETGDTDK